MNGLKMARYSFAYSNYKQVNCVTLKFLLIHGFISWTTDRSYFYILGSSHEGVSRILGKNTNDLWPQKKMERNSKNVEFFNANEEDIFCFVVNRSFNVRLNFDKVIFSPKKNQTNINDEKKNKIIFNMKWVP